MTETWLSASPYSRTQPAAGSGTELMKQALQGPPDCFACVLSNSLVVAANLF
jgi:hypothetical protein